MFASTNLDMCDWNRMTFASKMREKNLLPLPVVNEPKRRKAVRLRSCHRNEREDTVRTYGCTTLFNAIAVIWIS